MQNFQLAGHGGDPGRGETAHYGSRETQGEVSAADKHPTNGTGAQNVTCLESSQRDAPICPAPPTPKHTLSHHQVKATLAE